MLLWTLVLLLLLQVLSLVTARAERRRAYRRALTDVDVEAARLGLRGVDAITTRLRAESLK